MEVDFFEQKKQETGVNLSAVQREAVEHTEGALLVLASPGSGKTTMMIMKIGYLIEEKDVDPSRIRAVTFSNASATDMDNRFDKLFPHLKDNKVKFSTIHSFAFEVVRAYFKKNNIRYQLIEGNMDKPNSEPCRVVNKLNKRIILRRIFREVTQENVTEEQMEELLSYISYIKNKLIPYDQLEDIETSIPSASEIFLSYEEFKCADFTNRLVDYDDMLVIANDALEKDAGMLAEYQSMFDYFLTDESQDNSLVQNLIIEKLVRLKGNICVVADDDQSIYGWRGAAPEYLLNFKEVYPNAKILYMVQNYRSTKDIVEVANQFIKRNKNRYDKEMFTEKESFKPIQLSHLDTYEAQIRHIVEKVKYAPVKKEVAILYRNNSSSIALIDELEHQGIPFYIKDSDNKFFSHWIIEDILNFMRMSYSDKHPILLEKIHTKFNGYINKPQIEYLKEINNKASVFDNLLKLNVPVYQRKNLGKCKEIFKRINQLRPDQAIRVIRDELGYEKKLVKMCESLGFKKEYLLSILNTLQGIGSKLETLKDFAERLNYLRKVLSQSKFEKGKDVVTLSTFHSSKGLEFNQVIMIDLIEGVIPSKEVIKDFKSGKIDEMEEAVRLFYVGMTRARTDLELISYKRKDGESVQESSFVKDVKQIMFPNKGSKKKNVNQAKKIAFSDRSNAFKNIEEVTIGSKVKHATFGLGNIINVDTQIISIRFEKIGMKNLAAKICIEKGLLEAVAIADVG
ncbi:ATP-dependent helicase [Paenibacillus polymyxa]|uniref:DNA 3'-5' helicase n=1 Tax=Paenibacillus polymyxa (strain SC2) TaxID=886882 RepID=E3EKZ6_PAEPS|nr:ATP-dependent helicase [Paenibacillus polymyxa]ADO59901.1 helicase UvrD [Paenibacillus polymyxa SC2]WPQ59875.1 ATP-dependent helicase [Paenibacillus polymyxa]